MNSSFLTCIICFNTLAMSLCLEAQNQSEFKSRWIFDAGHLSRSTVKPVKGWLPGKIEGTTVLGKNPEHFIFDGKTTIMLADDHNQAGLPVDNLYVEAWARVDQPLTYGGLLGAIHDNGDDESGWLLGYQDSAFSFALASQATGRLTYLKVNENFEPERWYHVAATYNGEVMEVYVNGELKAQSKEQSGPILYPTRTWYEIGAYHDSNEYFKMTGGLQEVAIGDKPLTASEIRERFLLKADLFPEPEPKPEPLELRAGPFATWEGEGRVRFRWETKDAGATILTMENERGHRQVYLDETSTQFHEVLVGDLEKDSEYHYTLSSKSEDGSVTSTSPYLFDTTFYYEPVQLERRLQTFPTDNRTTLVETFVDQFIHEQGVTQGYCLILGAEDGRLATELAYRTDMQVMIAESDPVKVGELRKNLDRAQVYGARVSVHHVKKGDSLPYGPYFANFITSESTLYHGSLPDWSASEVYRVLRPCGGVLKIGQSNSGGSIKVNAAMLAEWGREAGPSNLRLSEQKGLWIQALRPALEGAGEWSHQYGGADNSSCSQDEIVQGDLRVLWWGEPGPRPMPDRGPRNPAPLSVNGRLFVQGDRILFGLDAYNGSMLWTLFNPEMRRANLIRDSSNMVASNDHLYLAEAGYCWAIDAQHGTLTRSFRVPLTEELDREYDWSYLAVVGDILIGSAVRSDSRYLGDDGEWYENFSDQETSKIVSESLFAFDRYTGQKLWEYDSNAIINSTITIGDGVIYLIESGNEKIASQLNARIPNELLTDTRLVAIDLEEGTRVWDKPQDFSNCQYMIYMSYANGKLAVTGTDKDKNYHIYAFNTLFSNPESGDSQPTLQIPGTMLWEEKHKEDKGHHSGHLQHPVIIGDTFYSDQRALDLNTGEILRKDLPKRRGCGTMSAGLNSIFFRHYFHSMWDLKSDKRTQFEGIRPGCWLGLIPANGLLLAPESSAGCSCTHSIQTTVSYAPVGAR